MSEQLIKFILCVSVNEVDPKGQKRYYDDSIFYILVIILYAFPSILCRILKASSNFDKNICPHIVL